MARLASQEKLGFYPTPPVVVELVKRSLERTGNGKIRFYDPCAGGGDAIAEIANHLQAESFGVELDKKRAEEAKTKVNRLIHGDSLRVSISGGSVSCLFLNPPYHRDETGWLENKFLVQTAPSLQAGGVLIFIVSLRSFNRQMVRYLASMFRDVKICRFPKGEFDRFKQIVLFGNKLGTGIHDPDRQVSIEKRIAYLGSQAEDPFESDWPVYAVPVSTLSDKHFHFRNLEVTPEEMIKEVEDDGVEKEIFDFVVKRNGNVKMRPAAPLRKGHLAILVASGMTDGIVEKDGKRMLIKGTVKKEKIKTVESDETVEKITETDVLRLEIMGLDLKTGELFSIQ